MSKVTSIRLSDETMAKLDKLAAAMERPRSWIIEQAIKEYIADNAWQVEQIREALDDYRAGTAKLIPHEEVMRHIDEMIREKLGDADTLGSAS
jgi:predicted transcriptional regulator